MASVQTSEGAMNQGGPSQGDRFPVGDDLMVIEFPEILSKQQRSVLADEFKPGMFGRKVMILDGGAKLARNHSEQLDRIEAKLDALCESLAAEDDEGEDKHMTTLDGRAVRATGTAGESM